MTRPEMEALLNDCGRAINANNGRCPLIEDVLLRCSYLLVELLPQETEQEHSERLHRENDPHYFTDDDLFREYLDDDDIDDEDATLDD